MFELHSNSRFDMHRRALFQEASSRGEAVTGSGLPASQTVSGRVQEFGWWRGVFETDAARLGYRVMRFGEGHNVGRLPAPWGGHLETLASRLAASAGTFWGALTFVCFMSSLSYDTAPGRTDPPDNESSPGWRVWGLRFWTCPT